ncbi:MAG: hypothetical protein M3303_07895 [Gemmatimonadota bacterium]|nr:hypothetical protein [Gemmatimonadota bacterium]
MLLVCMCVLVPPLRAQDAPIRLSEGRFTVVADRANAPLARSLLEYALSTDTFPGLPRPRARVTLAMAANARAFRELIGPTVPEWGSAVAFPNDNRVVMQGRRAGARAGDPFEVLRHELAHLALHETLGDLAPRWFDEGYASFAAREWSREDALRTNLALVIRGTPTLDELERWFSGGASRAEAAYALAYRAVAELAELDPRRGLTVLFREWKRTGKLDSAIRNAYGLTLAGFETRWRDRTRRRYGGLAVLADVTLGALLVVVAVLPLYVARRRRDRRRMAALVAADEAADRAARASALAILLQSDSGTGGSGPRTDAASPEPGDTR